jgi:TonB family protein
MPDNGPGPVVIPKTSRPPKDKPQLSVPKPKPAPSGERRTTIASRDLAPLRQVPSPEELAKQEARKQARLDMKRAQAEAARAKAQAAAAARLAAAQARALARAQARQRRLELSRELAGLQNPDEAVTDASDAPSPAGEVGRTSASLEDGPSAAGDSDLRDSLNSPAPMGGGVKRTEGSISWSIDGPIGTRRLLKRTLPVSPEWVSQRGLDLTVQVKFQVLEDGSVKPGAIIKVTSGFPELDRLAIDAIKLWKFESVPERDATAPQTWGVVSFRFTMG